MQDSYSEVSETRDHKIDFVHCNTEKDDAQVVAHNGYNIKQGRKFVFFLFLSSIIEKYDILDPRTNHLLRHTADIS